MSMRLFNALTKLIGSEKKVDAIPNRPTVLLVFDIGHIPKSSSAQRRKWQTCRGSHGCKSRHVEVLIEGWTVYVLWSASGMWKGNKCWIIADPVEPRGWSRRTEWER